MVDLNFMAEIAPDMIAALFMTVKLSILSVSISILLGAVLTFARTMGGFATRYVIIFSCQRSQDSSRNQCSPFLLWSF